MRVKLRFYFTEDTGDRSSGGVRSSYIWGSRGTRGLGAAASKRVGYCTSDSEKRQGHIVMPREGPAGAGGGQTSGGGP